MKTKFVRNGKTQRREMLVATQRGETLDTKRADKLADGPSALLLAFAYERQRGGTGALLHYDVEGLWSLRTYLSKRPMSQDELMGLLEAVTDILDLCAELRLGAEGLLFDPEYVFVDAQCRPHFALLPLDNLSFQARNSPLALLSAIGEAEHLRFATPDAEGLSRRLHQLVVDLDGVFSINNYRRFVEDERSQGDAGVSEARRSVVEPGTSSVWASAGAGGTSEHTADSGALFWSPLAGFAEDAKAEPEAKTPQWSEPVVDMPALRPTGATPSSQGGASVSPATPEVVPDVKGDNQAIHLQMQVVSESVSRALDSQPQVAAPVAATQAPLPHVAQAVLVRPLTGERFPLPVGTELVVGRGSSCAIRLRGNPKISRTHAALTWTGQMLTVRDLGAVNGVWVNGLRLASQQMTTALPGQAVRFADETILLAVD